MVQDKPFFSRINWSAIDNFDFVVKAISELLINGCIIETKDVPYVVNPLTVAISDSGKERLVLDHRHVHNIFVPRQNSMKMPEIFDDLGKYLYNSGL
jgi:hypothetical protein